MEGRRFNYSLLSSDEGKYPAENLKDHDLTFKDLTKQYGNNFQSFDIATSRLVGCSRDESVYLVSQITILRNDKCRKIVWNNGEGSVCAYINDDDIVLRVFEHECSYKPEDISKIKKIAHAEFGIPSNAVIQKVENGFIYYRLEGVAYVVRIQ